MLQHVPRINGEIPSSDEATSDHQRLLGRYINASHFYFGHAVYCEFNLDMILTVDAVYLDCRHTTS